MVSDQSSEKNLLFDFYQNIKNGDEVLSIEDLNVMIEILEHAKEKLKIREQKRILQEEINDHDQGTDKNGKILYLPNNLKCIYKGKYKNNKEIEKVVINEGLTDIGEYAFEGCTNLKEVIFPKNRVILRRGCFKDCTSIKEIVINDVANICPSAFENCKRLESVYLPKTVSNIYSRAFKDCSSLSKVVFAEKSSYFGTNTSLFPRAFENCISLETIDFATSTFIDTESFWNCLNLKTIYVHDNCIYRRKFKNCDAELVRIW